MSVVNVFGVLGGRVGVEHRLRRRAARGGIAAHCEQLAAVRVQPGVVRVRGFRRRDDRCIWGRVYCGRICAFGALTQLIDAVVPKRFQLEIPAEARAPRGLHQVRHPVRRDRLLLRHERDRVLPLHRAVLAVHVRRDTRALGHGRRAARREHLRPQSLLPLPLPARRRARPRLEGDDGVRRSSAGPSAASARSARRPASGARSASGRSSRRSACAATTARSSTTTSSRCPHWLLELKRKARAALGGQRRLAPRAAAKRAPFPERAIDLYCAPSRRRAHGRLSGPTPLQPGPGLP